MHCAMIPCGQGSVADLRRFALQINGYLQKLGKHVGAVNDLVKSSTDRKMDSMDGVADLSSTPSFTGYQSQSQRAEAGSRSGLNFDL